MKGMAETSIGSLPGTIGNSIYSARGVRIREHPIRDKILAERKAMG